MSIAPEELLEGGADAAAARRLAAYWKARDGFIAAGQAVRPSADPRRMLAQVREPLLAVLRTSPDFRPAYDPLLRLAAALARTDAVTARTLLEEMAHLQPARHEAGELLRQLRAAPLR